MKVITLGFKEDGQTVLLAGAEKTATEQRRLVDGYRSNGLPDGLVKVEIWQRDKIKVAVRPSAESDEGIEDSAEAESATEKEPAEPAKSSKTTKQKGSQKQSGEAAGDAFA